MIDRIAQAFVYSPIVDRARGKIGTGRMLFRIIVRFLIVFIVCVLVLGFVITQQPDFAKQDFSAKDPTAEHTKRINEEARLYKEYMKNKNADEASSSSSDIAGFSKYLAEHRK